MCDLCLQAIVLRDQILLLLLLEIPQYMRGNDSGAIDVDAWLA